MDRYVVRTSPWSHNYWVILDRELWDVCSLSGGRKKPNVPLVWSTKSGADAWLQRCYRLWGAKEVRPPARWRPHPPQTSPWA